MGVPTLVFVGLSVACTLVATVLDWRMQKYRNPNVQASRYRWVPLRWFGDDLYVGSGIRYRKWTLRFWMASVGWFLGALITATLGY